MHPEEDERLVGWHVVEVRRRVAHPFLNLADPTSGREVRVFIDATLHVSPGHDAVGQHDDEVFSALDALTGLTVRSASSDAGDLRLHFDDAALHIEGLGNELTSHSPRWVGGPDSG